MQAQFAGRIGPVQDPTSRQMVGGTVQGAVVYEMPGGSDPNAVLPQLQAALLQALTTVINQKLAAGQVAIPTIAGSLPYFQNEIIAASGAHQHGVQITGLQLQVAMENPYAVQPHAGPLPPNPMQAMQNAFTQEAKERLDPSNYEVKAKLNVGGIKIGMSSKDGVDTGAIGDQLKDKAKSTVIWWAIGCVAVLFVVALLGGIGIYAYMQVAGGSSATADRAASWDGKTPFVCGGNDKVKISGVSAKIASGAAVTAGGNCMAELVNVTIDAPIGVAAMGNGKITVKGGSVTGSQYAAQAIGSGALISFDGTTVNGKTNILGGAKIAGP
jgi:hypothetical protein